MSTITSFNLHAFARAMLAPVRQEKFEHIGDSIGNTSYAFGMVQGYRDRFKVPWNGWTIHASNGTSHLGNLFFYNAGNGNPTDTMREPGAALSDGTGSNRIPVWHRDVVYPAGSMGTGKYAECKMLSANHLFLATPNFIATGPYRIRHRAYIYDSPNQLPSASFMAARANSGVVNVVRTKPGTPTQEIVAVDCGVSSLLTADPSCELRGNSAVAATGANTMIHCGASFDVLDTIGVHWMQSISFGGWRTVDHIAGAKYSAAGLLNWYKVNGPPTLLMPWLGQNQDATESAQLAVGNHAAYKANLLAATETHQAAIVGCGAPRARVCYITQYYTAWNPLAYAAMAQAQYEISQADPLCSFINLFSLAGGVNFDKATYLQDGVHPNLTGQRYLASLIQAEMERALIGRTPGGGASVKRTRRFMR